MMKVSWKLSFIISGHLSNYRSKMHVDFEFGSNQEDVYNFTTNHKTSKVEENGDFVTNPPISGPWSSSMSLDLMF